MFILGLAVGLQISVLTFAIGFNIGVDKQKDLKKFKKEKYNLLTGIIE